MAPAVLDRSAVAASDQLGFSFTSPQPARPARGVPMGGGATLDELLVGAWEGLAAHRAVACPVCRGPMHPRYGAAGHAALGGRCDDCGSSLS